MLFFLLRYLFVDRETKFRLPVPGEDGDEREHRAIKCIASNREKIFVAVVTSDCIYIWLAHPHLLLCALRISAGDVIERGTLNKAYWNYDSSHIVITTSRNNLLIYRVVVSSENCYNLIDPPDVQLRRCSQELFLRGPRPSLSLSPSIIVNLAASATCCVPLREELFVCLRNGFIHHISWDGQVRTEYSLKLSAVPFAHDQLQSKPEFVTDPGAHVIDAVYAPLVGGYCIVLSDGRAALLTSSDSRFHPSTVLGVWAMNMKDASCCDVNHKFRLLTFGCLDGDVAAYHLDDSNGSLVQTFRVALKVQNGPDVVNRVGSVSDIEVLTSGGAFVAVWSSKTSSSNGNETCSTHLPATLAVFTPFGTQTWCSLESIADSDGQPAVSYTSVDWGPEGYHLWLGRNDGLSILPMARSAALCNPIMDHADHVVLLCSSRVLISSRREREGVASAPHAVWTTVNPPHEYIASNWPIRFAAVDRESAKYLVVAGLRGLAHCTLPGGRWKIFGNESHVWLPLVSGRRAVVTQDTSFISKRIMLPFELDICPLVICANDCLAVGVESLPFVFYNGGKRCAALYSLHRNSEVFAHHILRQLLKRNLGIFALEVAAACRHLPHFAHSLELLLHGVLEEEATSSEPIPDPLLPRCVAFIQEFPEFLRTVAHCARKTELALWPSLFAVTGSPNDLFEQAIRLLREALAASEWNIAKDMIRFTRAIGCDDMDSPARTPPPMKASSSRRHATSISNVAEADDLVFARFQAGARVAKVRHSHAEGRELNRKDSAGSGKKVDRHLSNDIAPPSPTQENPVAEKMGAILQSHGAHLLEEYCVRDLGFFVSALDLDISRILSASRKPVQDFPTALTRLHSQFSWPYPVASKKFVDHLEKRIGSIRCSQSSMCLNGGSSNDTKRPSIQQTVPETAVQQERAELRLGSSSPSGDSASVEDAPLVPIAEENGDSGLIAGSTLPSPCSSMAFTGDTMETKSIASDLHGLKLLVGETSNQGSAEGSAQMSQLLTWFSAAGRLDWVFLICLVSRDIVQIRREINAESVKKCGAEMLKHTMLGCGELLEWATQNCLGYVSILQVFAAHLDIIAESAGLPRRGAIRKASVLVRNHLRKSTEKAESLKLERPPPGKINPSPPALVVNPKLQESFALPGRRVRERSRSVDRGNNYRGDDFVVGSTDPDNQSCTIS
ncbi:unnamed protein product [Nippostrongylus brasiliensis]|uniref:Protein RIC1 homolog n=1 Tax=Nippostrongylus brasiliensis TaxID=27835 RepID=A0A0N4YQ68_NIPBR|nr:unnamed protein product [Nippostrongylus brasiliensis]